MTLNHFRCHPGQKLATAVDGTFVCFISLLSKEQVPQLQRSQLDNTSITLYVYAHAELYTLLPYIRQVDMYSECIHIFSMYYTIQYNTIQCDIYYTVGGKINNSY